MNGGTSCSEKSSEVDSDVHMQDCLQGMVAAEADEEHVDLSSLNDEICSEEFKREKMQVDDDIVIPDDEEEEFKASDSQVQE